jgi:hypothetical protein
MLKTMVSRAGLEPATTALKVRSRHIPRILSAENKANNGAFLAPGCTEFRGFGARHGARHSAASLDLL